MCKHGKHEEPCLVCLVQANPAMEELRIAAGLSLEAFETIIRECVEKKEKDR